MAERITEFDPSKMRRIEVPDTRPIEEALGANIIGQPGAVKYWASVINSVLCSAPKLRRGPLAVITQLGPSGVGKTEIVKAAAAYLQRQSTEGQQLPPLLRIDCGEFMEEHQTAKLLGAPPGYIGYGHTPRLAQSEVDKHLIPINNEGDKVAIILFDEIEKAHSKIQNLLLGPLDYGKLTLGDNKQVDLTNCIIVFTSNLGNQEIQTEESNGKRLSDEEKRQLRMDALRERFTQEQISRMGGDRNTLVFNELSSETVGHILMHKLSLLESILAQQGRPIQFQLTNSAEQRLVGLGYSSQYGVRPLELIIEREIGHRMIGIPKTRKLQTVVIDVSPEGIELYTPEINEEKVVSEREKLFIPEQKAREYGLKKIELPAYTKAQRIIDDVMQDQRGGFGFHIETPVGQEEFVDKWESNCPGLPMPCILNLDKSDFWYLIQLKRGNIIANTTDIKDPKDSEKKLPNIPLLPRFGEAETLYAMDWVEEDRETKVNPPDSQTKLQKTRCPLLDKLLRPDQHKGVVNIRREDLDAALWDGDPAGRIPTNNHKAILNDLGLDSRLDEIRYISQDEDSRGSRIQGWGTKNIRINYDGYFLESGEYRYGLISGGHNEGSSSLIQPFPLDEAGDYLAVRLVVARKH